MFHGQYPNALYGVTTEDAMNSPDRLFKADIDPKQVAAIVLEPVQGEGGFNVAPAEFMQALRALCDQHGILLIADEVQTGFARTGKLFAMEHYSVKPDLITMAKSPAGGMPLSAVAGRAEVMDAPAPGGLGGTYAGNPLAVAAAHAVLDVIDEEQLCQRAQRLGQHRWKCCSRRAKPARRSPMCARKARWWRWSSTIRPPANHLPISPVRCSRRRWKKGCCC